MSQADEERDLQDATKDTVSLSHSPANAAEAFQLADACGGSLQHRLDVYSGYSRYFYPKTNQVYDEIIGQLRSPTKVGPQVGSVMPNFVLPDQNGSLTRLDFLLANGPVVISLNRGHWCPWCRLQLRALAQIHDDVRRLSGEVISIMPETGAYSRKAVEDNKLPFRILTDLDFGYTLSLGMVIWVEKLRDLYLSSGLDLPRFQNNGGWFLPVPATFVVGVDGTVKARFADPDFRKRMEPRDILAALTLIRTDPNASAGDARSGAVSGRVEQPLAVRRRKQKTS
ncbi:MAG: peroxiredoxin-like family protein [Rhodomicrobium sp.]